MFLKAKNYPPNTSLSYNKNVWSLESSRHEGGLKKV
nr:MAG TPA: hypothetical protein [Caudoviricetes sp.]